MKSCDLYLSCFVFFNLYRCVSLELDLYYWSLPLSELWCSNSPICIFRPQSLFDSAVQPQVWHVVTLVSSVSQQGNRATLASSSLHIVEASIQTIQELRLGSMEIGFMDARNGKLQLFPPGCFRPCLLTPSLPWFHNKEDVNNQERKKRRKGNAIQKKQNNFPLPFDVA